MVSRHQPSNLAEEHDKQSIDGRCLIATQHDLARVRPREQFALREVRRPERAYEALHAAGLGPRLELESTARRAGSANAWCREVAEVLRVCRAF